MKYKSEEERKAARKAAQAKYAWTKERKHDYYITHREKIIRNAEERYWQKKDGTRTDKRAKYEVEPKNYNQSSAIVKNAAKKEVIENRIDEITGLLAQNISNEKEFNRLIRLRSALFIKLVALENDYSNDKKIVSG
jgi:hypothetical protein